MTWTILLAGVLARGQSGANMRNEAGITRLTDALATTIGLPPGVFWFVMGVALFAGFVRGSVL